MNTILAQLPAASDSQLVTIVIGFFVVLLAAEKIISIRRGSTPAPPAPGKESVTREELQHEIQSVTAKCDGLANQVTELKAYTHASVHELRDALQTLGLRLEVAGKEMLKEGLLSEARIVAKVTETDKRLERVLAKIGAPAQSPGPQ